MFDKDAIKELSQAEAIGAATTAIDDTTGGEAPAIVALPNDFSLHDLEKYMPNRRRLRGAMKTSIVGDFAQYVKTNAETGASVFVDPDTMSAVAVLNLGAPDAPGHADNIAALALRQTAACKALTAIATGQPLSQVQVAEFIEDWASFIKCYHGDVALENKAAVAAVRSITIEGLKRVQNNEQMLSASKSAFESVEAKADELLPTFIHFNIEPYHGLQFRTYVMRLAIRTGDKPAITLRVVNAEKHAEECAAELAARVHAAMAGAQPVLLGSYRAA